MPLRVPVNVSSITFTTSGVKVPASRIVSGLTPAEETAVVFNQEVVTRVISTNATTGAADIAMPTVITSITINGNVYAVASGKISAVVAADATIFLGNTLNQPFELVSGA